MWYYPICMKCISDFILSSFHTIILLLKEFFFLCFFPRNTFLHYNKQLYNITIDTDSLIQQLLIQIAIPGLPIIGFPCVLIPGHLAHVNTDANPVYPWIEKLASLKTSWCISLPQISTKCTFFLHAVKHSLCYLYLTFRFCQIAMQIALAGTKL